MADASVFEPVQAFRCRICNMIVEVPEAHHCPIPKHFEYDNKKDSYRYKWWI